MVYEFGRKVYIYSDILREKCIFEVIFWEKSVI